MSDLTTITINASAWARVTRERDDARDLAESAMWEGDRLRARLWKARDRAWKLARERNYWKSDCLEQCKLLAISADREETLRSELQQVRDCFYVITELAKGYKAQRDAMP